MGQQWAVPVPVCVHDADSTCIGTQIVRRSSVSTLDAYDLPFTHIQYHFLYARVTWEKTPSCCKHITKICSPSFLKWTNFQSEIGFHCIRLDNRSFPSCSSGWQISGTWKWYSMLCHCTNIVSGAPIISHFSYRNSQPCVSIALMVQGWHMQQVPKYSYRNFRSTCTWPAFAFSWNLW